MTISNSPPSLAVEAIDSGVARIIRRAVIYEADGETVWTPRKEDGSMGDYRRLVGGAISLDYNRTERRTLDVTLDNSDHALDISAHGFWYDKIIKVYRGVRYSVAPIAPHFEMTVDWETQLGEFMIDRITEGSASSTVKVTGRDYTKKCVKSKFEKSMSFPAGTFIYELIKALAFNSGIRKVNIPYTSEALTMPIDVERGTDRWSIMVKAASAFNYDIYFDNEGWLCMTKYPDPTLSPIAATFKTGTDGNLVSFEKSTNDENLYNHIVVTGNRESVEGGQILMPYFGEAVNTDPNSPTNVNEIGHRHYFYESSFFTDDSQCAELAQSWLRIYSLETYEINWSSIFYPWLDVGKVIQMIEPKGGPPMRFLLDTLNFPLDLQPMAATGKRVLAVG